MKRTIEEIILLSFTEELNPEDQMRLEQWTTSSDENQLLFYEFQKIWEGVGILNCMEKYTPEQAIRQVKTKIKKRLNSKILNTLQKAAAIFLLLMVLASVLIVLTNKPTDKQNFVAWHSLETPAGVRSKFILPDSTRVYLHPKTTLRYPTAFSDTLREVILSGAAYFEVQENREVPFIVRTDRLTIEVTGTEFVASNFPEENRIEVILVEGGITLFTGYHLSSKKSITELTPGERVIWEKEKKHMEIVTVDTRKYEAWRDGILLFRDDPLPEVVNRLNRWFNVDIQLEGSELKDWVYTATFEDETLEQALELLKLSAPIDYQIEKREINSDNTFSKMKVIIKHQNSVN